MVEVAAPLQHLLVPAVVDALPHADEDVDDCREEDFAHPDPLLGVVGCSLLLLLRRFLSGLAIICFIAILTFAAVLERSSLELAPRAEEFIGLSIQR